MRVTVAAELQTIRGGVEAYCRQLRLSGHGKDTDAAIDCLRRGVVAWCRGLDARGLLERVLRDKQVRFEPSDDTSFEVDISMA